MEQRLATRARNRSLIRFPHLRPDAVVQTDGRFLVQVFDNGELGDRQLFLAADGPVELLTTILKTCVLSDGELQKLYDLDHSSDPLPLVGPDAPRYWLMAPGPSEPVPERPGDPLLAHLRDRGYLFDPREPVYALFSYRKGRPEEGRVLRDDSLQTLLDTARARLGGGPGDLATGRPRIRAVYDTRAGAPTELAVEVWASMRCDGAVWETSLPLPPFGPR